MLTDTQTCQRWKGRAEQHSSCLCQVNPHSHHSSPNKYLSTKSQQVFVPAWEKNLRGKVESSISKCSQDPTVFKGPLKKRAVGFLLTSVSHWRGKLAICPAAPNSFHTVMLENEVEMTRHANPTISTPLMRRTTPPSQRFVSQARTLWCWLWEGDMPGSQSIPSFCLYSSTVSGLTHTLFWASTKQDT